MYTTFVAINGADGVAFVDKLQMSTSSGFPWRKQKKHLLPLIEDKELDPNVYPKREPTKELADCIARIEDCYMRGTCVRPILTGSLKDEPVSKKKASIGKVRVFCGAPVDWSIVVRKYFMSSVRLMQNESFAFETAIGVAAQSREWGLVYEHVTKFGKHRIVAGDYKAYDKRMPAAIILAAFDILIELSRLSGNFSEEDLLAMECIAHDTAFPLVDFHGDLIEFYGSNPSGHPLTVNINSLVNSLYMRYAYAELGGDVSEFQKYVSLLTYGDDNIMSVSEEVPIEYNHTSIQTVFSEIDIVYTMADKDAESVPYIDIEEATFLKRKWRYEECVKTYMAPLALESIIKMLMINVYSTSVPVGEQMASIIESAHGESFFHGRAYYDEMTELLQDAVKQCDLTAWNPRFLTWDEMVVRFELCSDRVRCPKIQHNFIVTGGEPSSS